MASSMRWTATMTAADARAVLDLLEISQTEFAAIIGVGPRTVRRWLSTDAQDATPIPPPVCLLLRLFVECPTLFQAVRSNSPPTQ